MEQTLPAVVRYESNEAQIRVADLFGEYRACSHEPDRKD
jgi:hypothetical protein